MNSHVSKTLSLNDDYYNAFTHHPLLSLPLDILDIEKNTPTLIKARHGAVATEEIHCSEIGVQGKQQGCLTSRNFWG